MSDHTRPIDRRRFIGALATTSALGAVLAACSSDDDGGAPETSGAPSDTGAVDSDTTETTLAPAESTTSSAPDPAENQDDVADEDDVAVEGWAVGGTDLLTIGPPDDSVFATAAMCSVALSQSTTRGPCYFADDTGEDISEGLTGLPMLLSLRVVDAECLPIEGQLVEVWHCDHQGVYSGDTSDSADADDFAGAFCTGGDDEGAASTWYRGQLTTDENGRVNFRSCFPGWYGGRTIHIHFAVSDGSGTRLVSQFAFSDELATDVYTSHEIYTPRGDQDTPLAAGTDGVFPANGFEDYLLTTQRNSDGTLLAYHNIQVV